MLSGVALGLGLHVRHVAVGHLIDRCAVEQGFLLADVQLLSFGVGQRDLAVGSLSPWTGRRERRRRTGRRDDLLGILRG